MRNYIIRRLLLIPVIMLGVSFLTFIMFRVVIPGDAAILACGFGCTPEVVQQVRSDLGLDEPWYEQYGDWVGGGLPGGPGEGPPHSQRTPPPPPRPAAPPP